MRVDHWNRVTLVVAVERDEPLYEALTLGTRLSNEHTAYAWHALPATEPVSPALVPVLYQLHALGPASFHSWAPGHVPAEYLNYFRAAVLPPPPLPEASPSPLTPSPGVTPPLPNGAGDAGKRKADDISSMAQRVAAMTLATRRGALLNVDSTA